MELILIRHGESEGNRSKVFQGWGRCPLTERGRGQAAKARSALRAMEMDKIYSSDSARALETAQLIFPGAEIEAVPALRETHCGELSGLTAEQAKARYGDTFTNRNPFDLRSFGGEHVSDMERRVRQFINTLSEKSLEGRIAVVAHGGPLKALTAYALHADFVSICDHITFQNCSISSFQLVKEKWVIQSLNSTVHLI